MEIRFEETTRGTGMVFTRVIVEGAPEGVTLEASNATLAGNPLPAEIYPIERYGGHVVCVPVFSIPQRLTVRVKDTQGDVVASTQRVVRPLSAKLSSQINTALRNEVALFIRNSNRRVRSSLTSIKVNNVIQGTKKESIVQGTISIFSTDETALTEPVTLEALGADARSVALAPVIIMSDETDADSNYPGAYSRTIQFSVPIDERQRSLVLWAYGSTGAVSDGVLALEPHMLTGLRMGWYTRTVSAERDPAYQEWFLEHHRTSERELEMQRKRYFEVRPVFSIIVPLYKTPLDYFHEMVESVLNQTYGRFELILVNASPENEKLSSAVDAYVERDSRVRRVDIAENLGITLNTNEGIKVATGDFVAFFDHDDILEPDILYRYAQGINDYPDTDLLYCDEDKYIEGKYEAPHLKPDWNPDLLCGCNYVTHMLTVRKSVLDTLELPGKEFDGAQDYHMTFRIAEKARNVFHARKVLYHWRVHPGSTAAASDAKPYTAIAGLRAVQAHLDRTGIDGTACHAKLANYYYIDYHFDEPPLVSIVIPSKDMAPVLTDCVDSILHKTDYANYEVVIVENGSVEPETFACYEELQKDERVRVVAFDTGGEFNFSKIINFGFNEAKGDYLLMLNNDTKVIEPAWLRSMMGIAQREDVGAVGAKLVYPDMTIQHAGVTVNRSNPLHIGEKLPYDAVDFFNYLNMTCDLVAVTGACLLTKRPVFEKVGGMDESFASDYNDVDFCLKMVAEGLRVVYDPQAFLFHYESLSRDVGESSERQLLRVREASRLQQKWPAYWALGDPFLSLNFRAGGQYRQLGW